nr:response regulator [uncultured Devosia sp.]
MLASFSFSEHRPIARCEVSNDMSSGSPYVILVVEDEIIIRMDMCDYLESVGYEVLECANADEAIYLFESGQKIDLLITDIDMPGSIDGLRLAAAVADRWPPVRIILLSGRLHVSEAERPAGSHFIGKPASHWSLDRSVADILQFNNG